MTQSRPSVAALLAITCAIALAASAPAALGQPSDARIATACPNLSVYGGKYVGTLNLRFVQLPKGWSCSYLVATESEKPAVRALDGPRRQPVPRSGSIRPARLPRLRPNTA